MQEFEVQSGPSSTTHRYQKMRLGRFGDQFATPSYMLYTRAGHIPHLTWTLATKHLHFEQMPPLIQMHVSCV